MQRMTDAHQTPVYMVEHALSGDAMVTSVPVRMAIKEIDAKLVSGCNGRGR